MLGSCKSNLVRQPIIFDILRWTSWHRTVLLIEGDTVAKATGFTSFVWEQMYRFSGWVTLVSRFLSAFSERVSLKSTDTALVTYLTLVRCWFSSLFISLIVGFRKFFEDWTHHGIISFWLVFAIEDDEVSLWGRKEAVKLVSRLRSVLWIVTLFRPSFTTSSSPESELSEFSGSAMFLAANLLALCKEVNWVTAPVNLLTCSIWHLKSSCSWVPIEARFFCKTSVKILNMALLLSMKSPFSCKRIRGGISWLAIIGNSSFSLILCACHDWCGLCRQIYFLSWGALKMSCRFTEKVVKKIFWNTGGTHSLCWCSTLRNEVNDATE